MSRKLLARIVIVSVVTHPVVIAVLSPYMIFVVGIDLDQWIIWAVGGMPISIVLNLVLAWFIPYISEKLDKKIGKYIKD